MQPRNHVRPKFEERRKLFETASRGFVRTAAIYRQAEAGMRQAWRAIGERAAARSRAAWSFRLLISSRLDEGRLPTTSAATTPGAPGFGGECEACDGYLPPTRLVMAIATGDTFVYLHADCYVIWRAECNLRAVLGRFA